MDGWARFFIARFCGVSGTRHPTCSCTVSSEICVSHLGWNPTSSSEGVEPPAVTMTEDLDPDMQGGGEIR